MSKTEISKQISSNKQASHGVRRSSVCIIGLALFLALAPSVARAQGTADQRAACTLYAFRLCGAEIPQCRPHHCVHKSQQSEPEPWLRSVFDKTNFLPRLAQIS
jgi:hypothetical protein